MCFPPLLHLHYSFSIHRVIPFVIIALILEEAIPLIAIYAPFMLPSTCILPSQQQRIEEQRAEKAKAFATQYKYLYSQLKKTENPEGFLPLQSLRLQEASTAVCGYVSSIFVERGLEQLFSVCLGFQLLAPIYYGYGASVVIWNSSQEMINSLCNIRSHFRIENCRKLLKSVECNDFTSFYS